MHYKFQLIPFSNFSGREMEANFLKSWIWIMHTLHVFVIFAITPWPLSWFFSNHKRFALHKLLHLQTDFQTIPSSGLPCGLSWKSLITLLFFIQFLQYLDCKCALICSYCPPDLKKSANAHVSYYDFSKVCEKNKKKIKKKNTKNTYKTNFAGVCLRDG